MAWPNDHLNYNPNSYSALHIVSLDIYFRFVRFRPALTIKVLDTFLIYIHTLSTSFLITQKEGRNLPLCAMSSAVTEARRPVAPGHGATAAPSCCEGRIFGPLGTSGHWNNRIFTSSIFQFQLYR